MRKGSIAALIALPLLGWLLVLSGRDAELAAATVEAAIEQPAKLPPPAEPVPRPRPPKAKPRRVVAAATGDTVEADDGAEPKPLVPLELPSEERRRRLRELTIKHRKLNMERLARGEARWEEETRDETWAKPHEKALQQSLVKDGIDSLLMDVECRQTLCRLEISAIDSNAAFALKGASGFARELGDQVATTMRGGAFDRVMVFYNARDGSSLDE